MTKFTSQEVGMAVSGLNMCFNLLVRRLEQDCGLSRTDLASDILSTIEDAKSKSTFPPTFPRYDFVQMQNLADLLLIEKEQDTPPPAWTPTVIEGQGQHTSESEND